MKHIKNKEIIVYLFSEKPKTTEAHEAYKKQRNYCVSLLRKTKNYRST